MPGRYSIAKDEDQAFEDAGYPGDKSWNKFQWIDKGLDAGLTGCIPDAKTPKLTAVTYKKFRGKFQNFKLMRERRGPHTLIEVGLVFIQGLEDVF